MKIINFRRQLLLTTFASSMAIAMSAPAQAADASTQANDSNQIQDIIVSARRRNETLQQTPIAMTAIVASQLESKASVSIADIQGTAPNLLITQQVTGGAAANISIRGLSFADIEKSFDPTVAVVVDGAFIGTSTGQLLDFFDIDSIEVLRGPQGNLFGRNTIGGVINIKRSRPKEELGGKFEMEYGSFNTMSERGVLHVPLVKDKLFAKVFAFHTQTDGFYKYYTDRSPRGGGNNTNFGASFLYKASEDFDALLTLEKQVSEQDNVVSNISGTGEVFCLFAAVPGECNRNTTKDLYTVFADPGQARYSSPAATLEMNWNAGLVKLTSLTNYRESKDSSYEDVDSFAEPFYKVDRHSKYRQISQELRASGQFAENFDFVVGGYFFDSKYTLNQKTSLFGGDFYQSQITHGTSQSVAAFGDFNWEFLPKLRLNFGGRVTHDKKGLDTSAPDGAGVFTDFGWNHKSWTKFTPKVSLDYRPTHDLMVYGSWSQGYRSGGFSGRGLDQVSATTPFNPEKVNSFEAGVKAELFDRRLTLNLAGFYVKYKDIQETITKSGGSTGNITIVENAASAKVKGIEADFTARPIDGLTVRGSLGYLHNRFSGFTNKEAWSITDGDDNVLDSGLHIYDYSGVNMIYAPKITASVSFEYKYELGNDHQVRLNGGYRYIGAYDQQVSRDARIPTIQDNGTTVLTSNDPRVRANKQSLLDASLSYILPTGGGETRITVFGRNLLDNRGPATAFTVAGLWSFATAREPRVYGVQVGYKF
ncbi:TonB-dependent receptor [Aquisediminimonas sediminicola]|uniref:TonB-dependent receptor n=1 Tax=Alteraquisediminimonas sediminicola TaxID=2676787 RepID=UPI001C8E79E6|nr:TonB-dependent receptor [Aquisediminimonas sediminicola]